MENGRFRTWKKEKQKHGIGIENVKDVVRRYQGTVDITYDAETFCVLLLFIIYVIAFMKFLYKLFK